MERASEDRVGAAWQFTGTARSFPGFPVEGDLCNLLY